MVSSSIYGIGIENRGKKGGWGKVRMRVKDGFVCLINPGFGERDDPDEKEAEERMTHPKGSVRQSDEKYPSSILNC